MSATIIAVISILISATALIGVVVSLILQARQLRASLLQASRATHAETVRMVFDHPEVLADILGRDDPEWIKKATYVNWVMQHIKMAFSQKVITSAGARKEVAELFRGQFSREWWASARPLFKAEAFLKREREFVTMVDEVFREVTSPQEPSGSSITNVTMTSPSSSRAGAESGVRLPEADHAPLRPDDEQP